jgi:hypothetical protein
MFRLPPGQCNGRFFVCQHVLPNGKSMHKLQGGVSVNADGSKQMFFERKGFSYLSFCLHFLAGILAP